MGHDSRSTPLPRAIAAILVCVLDAALVAQTRQELIERATRAEARLRQLEAENRSLRDALSVVPYLQRAAAGPRVEVEDEGRKLATLMIGPDGWGRAPAADIAAVAASVARTLYSAMPPARPLTIAIVRVVDGPPKALSAQGPHGEYVVQVNSGDLRWAQLAYQLAHEFGHVACGKPDPAAPQQWLEEAFCEACSLWTMAQMAESWQTAPPYPNWAPYAAHLRSYAEDLRAKVARPEDHATWYAEHRARLDVDAGDRELDRVIAVEILARWQARPGSSRAFSYLRRAEPPENTIEARLETWAGQCPDDLKFVPQELATLLGVQLRRGAR